MLDKDEQALAAAVAAVETSKNAAKALAAVPASHAQGPALHLRADPVSATRRQDRRGRQAACCRRRAIPPGSTATPGGSNAGSSRASCSTKATPRPPTGSPPATRPNQRLGIAEAEFHAGWYALEYLNDPATAKKHFAAILDVSHAAAQRIARRLLARPGRREGRATAPRRSTYYKRAGKHPTTFYGQLALASLGVKTPADRAAAADRRRDQGAVRIARAGAGDPAPRRRQSRRPQRDLLPRARRPADRSGRDRAARRHGRGAWRPPVRPADRQDRRLSRPAGRHDRLPDLGDPELGQDRRGRKAAGLCHRPAGKRLQSRRRSAAPARAACCS